MRVHELITALQTMPPNDEVRTPNDVDTPVPVYRVEHVSTYGEHFVVIDLPASSLVLR